MKNGGWGCGGAPIVGKSPRGWGMQIKHHPANRQHGLEHPDVEADLIRLVGKLGGRNKKAPQRRINTRVLAETESYGAKLSELQ